MSKPQYIFPAHDTDYKSDFARRDMVKTRCIHCGSKLFPKVKVMYAVLSKTNQTIWWHISPCCTPDDPEEYENYEN